MLQNLRFVSDADIVIAGGGAGGFLAATAVARLGVKTLVIEKGGFFGGTLNSGLVGTMWSLIFGEREVVRGIPGEFLDRLNENGGAQGFKDFVVAPYQPEYTTKFKTMPYNAEIYKIVADEMVSESGAKPLMHTTVTGVIKDEGRIRGLLVHSVDGPGFVSGKLFVDCTGNADVAFYAGAEVMPWEAEELQPITICFKMSNIDIEKYDTMPMEYRKEMAEKGFREGILPRIAFGGHKTCNPGEMTFNVVRVPGINGVVAEDLTRGEMEGRRQVKKIIQYFKEHCWGFEKAYLTAMGPVVGVRETRRILGHAVLKDEDVIEGLVPQDSIALGTGPMDAHKRGTGFSYMQMPKAPFGISYGSLVPVGLSNLLISGRNISATRMANAAMRHSGTCMAIGHAVGVAAAMCAQRNLSPAELPVQDLQAKLLEQGAIIR